MFSIISLWQILTPPERGQFFPKGMAGRCYEGNYQTLLHTKALGLVAVLEKKKFFLFIFLLSNCKSMGAVVMKATIFIQYAQLTQCSQSPKPNDCSH